MQIDVLITSAVQNITVNITVQKIVHPISSKNFTLPFTAYSPINEMLMWQEQFQTNISHSFSYIFEKHIYIF